MKIKNVLQKPKGRKKKERVGVRVRESKKNFLILFFVSGNIFGITLESRATKTKKKKRVHLKEKIHFVVTHYPLKVTWKMGNG